MRVSRCRQVASCCSLLAVFVCPREVSILFSVVSHYDLEMATLALQSYRCAQEPVVSLSCMG